MTNKTYPNDKPSTQKTCSICTDMYEKTKPVFACTHYNCGQDYSSLLDICDGCNEKIGCCGKCSCIPQDTSLSLIIEALEQSKVKARLYAYGGYGANRSYHLYHSDICLCFDKKGILVYTSNNYIENGYEIPILTLE